MLHPRHESLTRQRDMPRIWPSVLCACLVSLDTASKVTVTTLVIEFISYLTTQTKIALLIIVEDKKYFGFSLAASSLVRHNRAVVRAGPVQRSGETR